jgi:aspartate/tyrosine/aromatic aminotransferase
MHGCGQNPTGVDPTKEEWEKIASVVKVIYSSTFKRLK